MNAENNDGNKPAKNSGRDSLCYFSIGNDRIDEDHKSLFVIINNLNDIKPYNKFSNMIVSKNLYLLDECLCSHFKNEEDYMDRLHFPRSNTHLQAHKEFQFRLKHIILQYEMGTLAAIENLALMAQEWLHNHMQTDDRDFVSWLNQGCGTYRAN